MEKQMNDSSDVYGIVGKSNANYVFRFFELDTDVPNVACVYMALVNNPFIDRKYQCPCLVGETNSLSDLLLEKMEAFKKNGCKYIGIMLDPDNDKQKRLKTLEDIKDVNPQLF